MLLPVVAAYVVSRFSKASSSFPHQRNCKKLALFSFSFKYCFMPEPFWQQTPEATDNPIALNIGRFVVAVCFWGISCSLYFELMSKLNIDIWEPLYLFITVIFFLIGICTTVYFWQKSHRKEMEEQAKGKKFRG